MFWNFFSISRLVNPAEAMRQRHSTWLTRAFKRPASYPRIPARAVRDGGFDAIMATPDGRKWAEEWWYSTLRADDLDL
jgi:hypothetical protein